MASDAELLQEYAERGSERAFTELVQQHIGLVYHSALRQVRGDEHRAQEVAQSVFVDLARKAPRLSRHPALAAWLHTSVRYAALRMRRGEATRTRYEALADPPAAGSSAEWERLRPVIDEVLAALRESDRQAVLLRYFENQSFAELGSALGISEDAARMRVDRALRKMESLLARRGVVSTSTALSVALATSSYASTPAEVTLSISARALAVVQSSPAAAGSWLAASSLPTAATAIAVMLTLGIAGFTYRQLRADQARINALTQSAEDARIRAHRLDLQAAASDAASQQLQSELDALNAAAAKARAARAARAAADAGWNQTAKGAEFMTRHPTVRQALATYGLARARWDYQGLLKRWNLEPGSETQALQWIEGGHGMGASVKDDSGAHRQMNLAETRPETNPLTPEEMSDLAAYQNSLPGREIAGLVAGQMWETSTPLSMDQARQLAATITQNTNHDGIQWDAALAQASAYLAPDQLMAFQGLKAKNDYEVLFAQP